jgi:iron complex outermembrane receptor protein
MITPRHILIVLFACGLAGHAPAQQATPATPATEPAPGDLLRLPTFEVQAASDRGYGATRSTTGSRINVPIQDLAASLVTITPRLMQDINPQEPSDAAKYVSGVNTATAKYGGQFTIRGYNIIGVNHRDGLPETSIVPTTGGGATDLSGVERMEVIKGPAGILYGAHTMGGILNFVSKKPLPESQQSVKLTTGSWNFKRVDADSTGPITKQGNFLYRVSAAYQDADLPNGLPYDRETITGNLEYRFGANTKIWTRYNYLHSDTASDSKNWYTDFNQDFSTFMGQRSHWGESDWGRDIVYRNTEFGLSTSVTAGQATWDMRLVGRFNTMAWNQVSYNLASINMLNAAGVQIGRLGLNATTPTDDFSNPQLARIVGTRNRQNDPERNRDRLVTFDLVGDFELGATKHKLLTNFEMSSNSRAKVTYRWDYPDIELTNITHVSGDPLAAATNKTVIANNRSNSSSYAWGFQENMTILDDRVIVVGGARYDWRQQTDTNIFLNLGGVTESVSQWTYKYGVVGKPVKGVALFYNYSETFSPVVLRDVLTNERFPNLLGSMQEVGLKTELLDSRLITTLSYFDMVLENSVIFISDPLGGPGRLVSEGNANTKGWELDIAASPVKGLSVIAGIGDISSKTDAGLRRRGVSQGVSYKLFASYEFGPGALKGLSVGAGHEFANKRAGDTTDVLKMPSYDLTEFMLAYQTGAWRIQANIYNVFDKVFAFTSVNRNNVWPSEPRNFRLSAAYSF